jgi:glutathione S-transferase
MQTFQGDYEDGRYDSPPEGLASNLGRMPVAQIGDETIGQSVAINFYIASENGLMGESALDAAKILSVGEHLKELMASYRTLVAYGDQPTEEASATWFETGATDVLGVADVSKRNVRYFQWYLGRIEQALDTEGFAGTLH